jgi:hypothetical protein
MTISIYILRKLKPQKSLNEIAITKASKQLNVLRRKASTQDRARKKKKIQEQNGISVSFNTIGRPLLLNRYSSLNHEIMNIVDDGMLAASHRRRRNVVNVRSIMHIKEQLRAQANIDTSYSSVLNYTLPRNARSLAAKTHHTPPPVQLDRIERSEIKKRPDGNYCAASQKYLRDLAGLLGNRCVFISQDDKAKV